MFRLLTLATALAFAATSAPAQESVVADKATPASAELRVADRYNKLGVSLFTAVRQARPGNFVVSSWPTHRSLALAQLGASEETRRQIAQVIGSEDPIADEKSLLSAIDPGIAAWNQAVAARQPGDRVDQVEWGTVSGVWIDSRVKVLPRFAAEAGRMHGTLIRALDFQNSGKAITDVNQWIAQITQDRVPRLLDAAAFTRDTRLALSSATFFKAPWAYGSQFKRENTRSEPFRVNGGTPQPVLTMIQRATFGSAVHDDFTAITLPTAGGFHLLLLVPSDKLSIAALEERLTPELLQDCAKPKTSRIELHLPRFRIASSTFALRPVLQAMGMRLAFEDEKANFRALSSTPLKLGDVFDAAEFRIDENGLSGAAATVVTVTTLGGDMSALPAESTFRVDRPFLFALQHAATGYCVFLGKVTDPR